MTLRVGNEVNLSIDREIEAAFRHWLVLHAEKLLESDGFLSAAVTFSCNAE